MWKLEVSRSQTITENGLHCDISFVCVCVGGGGIIKPVKDIWRGSLIESLNMLTKPMMQTEVNFSFFFFL